MKNRKLLTDEQLDTVDKIYALYYKYIISNSNTDWIAGSCYIRVSTNEQDKFSPLSQLKEILEYALQHNIYIAKEHIYQDIGKSGMKDIEKRVDFLRLIETAKTKVFKTLLLYRFSRFARTKEDSVYYKAKLRKEYGIEIISIKEALPTDNSRVLLESMYEGSDEYYVLNFRDEAKRGKKEKITRGEWLYGAPYGYYFDRNTQTLIIDEEKAKNVKLIYEKFNLEPNLCKLVRTLNSLSISAPKSDLWASKTVKRILQNPTYIGYIRYCEGGFKTNYNNENIILFKGLHSPILEEELFNEVQVKVKGLYTKYRKYARAQGHHMHWLSSILKCDNCGLSLTRTFLSSRKPFFQCSGYHKGSCTISHHIKEETVIPLILEQLKKDFTEKLEVNIVRQTENYNYEISNLEKELEQLNTKLKRIKKAYEEGIDSLLEYKDNKNKILRQIEKANKDLKVFKNKNKEKDDKDIIYKKCDNAFSILSDDNAPINLKIEIARDLFEKIVYEKSTERLIIHYKI